MKETRVNKRLLPLTAKLWSKVEWMGSPYTIIGEGGWWIWSYWMLEPDLPRNEVGGKPSQAKGSSLPELPETAITANTMKGQQVNLDYEEDDASSTAAGALAAMGAITEVFTPPGYTRSEKTYAPESVPPASDGGAWSADPPSAPDPAPMLENPDPPASAPDLPSSIEAGPAFDIPSPPDPPSIDSSSPDPTTLAMSLIELLTVIAIIAILAALLIPKIIQHKEGMKTGDPHELMPILQTTNGITVYRFYDGGNFHYFIDARGSTDTTHDTSVGKVHSTQAEEIPTVK